MHVICHEHRDSHMQDQVASCAKMLAIMSKHMCSGCWNAVTVMNMCGAHLTNAASCLQLPAVSVAAGVEGVGGIPGRNTVPAAKGGDAGDAAKSQARASSISHWKQYSTYL